jgi:hypothetical protein
LEKGNGAELDPVPDIVTPVPVPVGPNPAVDELLSGNGTLAVFTIDPPVPVEKIPDGLVPQDGDTAVGPVPEVELETGKGAGEGVGEDNVEILVPDEVTVSDPDPEV